MLNKDYFNIVREKALVSTGSHFFCDACLYPRPIAEQSADDPRYCRACYAVILADKKVDGIPVKYSDCCNVLYLDGKAWAHTGSGKAFYLGKAELVESAIKSGRIPAEMELSKAQRVELQWVINFRSENGYIESDDTATRPGVTKKRSHIGNRSLPFPKRNTANTRRAAPDKKSTFCKA